MPTCSGTGGVNDPVQLKVKIASRAGETKKRTSISKQFNESSSGLGWPHFPATVNPACFLRIYAIQLLIHMKYFHILTISFLLIGCGGQSIHQDVIEGNVALVRRELTKGVDVNQKNDEGRTPLHLAAGIANKEIAELLIEKGANINSRDKRGLTPLDYAVEGEEMSEAFSEISNMKGVEVVSSNSYVRNEDGSLREKRLIRLK